MKRTLCAALAFLSLSIAAFAADADNISFKRVLSFNSNEITISYTGVVKGDTIEMKRDTGRGSAAAFTAKKAK